MRIADKFVFMIMHYGTGQPNEKCKDCMHLKLYQRGNHSLYKCEIYGESMSAATDWKASNSACGIFNKPCDDRNIYRLNHKGNPLKEIDGQIGMEL